MMFSNIIAMTIGIGYRQMSRQALPQGLQPGMPYMNWALLPGLERMYRRL